MIDESAAQQEVPGRPHRLTTFGTLALVAAGEDTLLGKHGHHRRRLALLAVLAAAGDRGRSRDQLLSLFWPEATQSRARHSLDQLLYALRSSIGESVFASVNPVRLNPDVVRSDVGEFLAAIERGDLEVAVAEYAGPFLDGFYLGDAPEFERWVEVERTRLGTMYSGLLERLAQTAEAAHDHSRAVRWRRALSEADPLSSKNATGLIRALMNAGDRAAALQYAERYEKLLAQELGVSADHAVADLVAEARARTVRRPASPPEVQSPPIVFGGTRPEPAEDGAPRILAQPRTSGRRHLGAYAIGMLILVVLVGITALRAKTSGDRLGSRRDLSVAVLPLANVSRDQQDVALADGLTEALIAVLAKIPNLRVIARTSVFAFKNSDVDVRRIADSLGVSNVLEGSVQKVGSNLRVQVRLVDARDGSTRWSETYDRELSDIFAVQSDIAGAVARALDLQLRAGTLAAIKRGSTSNVAAYELYLRGNDPALLRSDSGARAGFEYFRQAIALDSGYAAAYAGLARMLVRSSVGKDKELPLRERLALAEQAALKAVALDDSLGEAHATLGIVRRSNFDLGSAETELKRAMELDPTNALFHEWLVLLYVFAERPADALLEARRALELDPLSPAANAEVAHALLANDRCDEALAQLDKLRLLRPPLLRVSSIAAQCYARKKMWPAAIAELQRTSANAGARGQAQLGYVLARAGRTNEARQILTALLDRSRRIDGGAFEVAIVYAGLGENGQAFTWLDKAVDDRSLAFDAILTVRDDLGADPRFDNVRRRIGLQKR